MIKGIRGVKDILPEETPRWRFIEETARRWAERCGFHEIRLPIFEATALFARSIGATTDIVEKEMYTFPDRDGTLLTLRPEGTAGTVRSFVEHNRGADPLPQKYYYLGPMFRHERPQAGRLRQFHQFGVEYFGTQDARADVEVMSLLWRFLSDLTLPDLTLEVNSLGTAADRAAYLPVLVAFLKGRTDRLCANCLRRIDTNPLRVLDCKVPECRAATDDAPRLTDHLSPEARTHFAEVLAGLTSLDIPYHLNARLVRGLDYYCLTAFEVTSSHLGAQNAVGAGGRYDGLVETLGGPHTPAIGFAAGLERISLMLPDTTQPVTVPSVYVASFGTDGAPAGIRVLDALRRAGLVAQTDYRSTTLKAHLRQADRARSRWAVLLGDDEVRRGSVIVRHMGTKAQAEVPFSEIPRHILAQLSHS
ncbi:Histidine--tRNA ligase [Nitrospira japonica]|uniref:Histidine--tRNA ligase n=1 Tax=Nitrospira japonica TaxID=1325564 RepID=A0A1W1I2F5_9BACT|nr:histidine--tRNA ligase [Nitrospira japonica]SLM47174.1 Histidine--tRNA ligase [Nitrospira japonica]